MAGPPAAPSSPRRCSDFSAARPTWGDIRLSLCSTAEPLYTRFPIIFSRCFSKVTVGYNPSPTAAGDIGIACSDSGSSIS
jgi:hypothetical protein